MDMLVAIIQIACIAGLLCGLYLSVTYVETDEVAESFRRRAPRRHTPDPLIADAFRASQPPSSNDAHYLLQR